MALRLHPAYTVHRVSYAHDANSQAVLRVRLADFPQKVRLGVWFPRRADQRPRP